VLALDTARPGPYAALEVTRPERVLSAPEFELPDLAGASHRLRDYRGRVVVLHFWATFCRPCREELPSLQSLWRRYRDRGLTVLAVAADRGGRAPPARFVERHIPDLPVLWDREGRVRNAYEVWALPTTYLLRADGRFAGRVVGARDWSSPAALALVRDLLPRAETR
ncbi:MAG: TlpA family protein disulfide reductase, partial [Gammaproteobacteria bacterium]|nr:TlpA family protein disulfide reductase [Gammaproteobacteria bacterium]